MNMTLLGKTLSEYEIPVTGNGATTKNHIFQIHIEIKNYFFLSN